MKKQFTFIGAFLFATSLSMAQNMPTLPLAEGKSANVLIETASPIKNVVTGTTKAGGDILWESTFADTTIWTKGTTGQGGFQFGQFPSGQSGYFSPATFTSSTDGYAYFNGIQYLIAASVSDQNAYITSPSIDVTGISAIEVEFQQTYRHFNYSKTFVEVSFDGGTTWVTKQVNTTVAGNSYNSAADVNQKVTFGNPTSATSALVRFRWNSVGGTNASGSGYGWAIDDVKVKEAFGNNMRAGIIYSAVGEQELSYTKIPASQAAGLGKVGFGIIAENVGANTVDAELTVSSGSYSFTTPSLAIQGFAKDSLGIDIVDGFQLPSALGLNTVTYTVGSSVQTLEDTADDAKSLGIEITDGVYATDSYNGTGASMTGSFTGWQSGTGDPGIGTLYEIVTSTGLLAFQVGIANIGATSAAQYYGNQFQVKLFKLGTESWEYVYESPFHTIVAGDFGNLVTLNLDYNVTLEPGAYLPVAVFTAGGIVPIAMSGFSLAGTTLGMDGEDFIRLRSQDETPGIVNTPIVRMVTNTNVGINKLDANEMNVSVYPNPVSDKAEISFTLESANDVAISITDLSGREVMSINSTKMAAGNHTIVVDNADLTAGVYTYSIQVGNSVITKKVIKK